VHFIDVGQGDCTLIKSPNGKYMLVDAGTSKSQYKICDYLEDSGVQTLEYLILTHPHEDHIGSADVVLDTFKVNNVLMTDKQHPSSAFDGLVDSLWNSKNTHGTKIYKPNVSEVYDFDGIQVEILSDGKAFDDLNDSSIVIRLNYYDTSVIISGDAGKIVENQILDSFSDITAQLYKCAHHGSATSNSAKFLKAVNPEFAVVSCELDNSYGHPHEKTLKALYDLGTDVYRTDEQGDIVFCSDGIKFEFYSQSKDIYNLAA
jgi:competence protein ComEC